MKKKAKMITAAVLCAALTTGVFGVTVSASASAAEKPANDSESRETSDAGLNEEYKDETVYVIAGADGEVHKVIVSDWIKNSIKEDLIQDKTRLSDIETVKGDESCTFDGDNSCIWDADGNDIYYKGNIEKELPVQMTVSYTLDGKSISPEVLAGKSGHVTIRFDYKNLQTTTVSAGGRTENMYVPFTMMTGMLLDTDSFRNVSVSNGKLINDGDRTAVVGIAFPGLQEDLKVGRDKIDIPDYVEISADVENFEMSTTMTLATTEVLGNFDSGRLDTEKMSGAIDGMTSGMDQLLDGSSKLYDGVCTLLEKSGELISGIDQLAAGVQQLKDGADSLDVGAEKLLAGAQQLSEGLDTLNSKRDSLNGGAKQVFETLLSTADSQLKQAGMDVPELTIENYAEVLNNVISSLDKTAAYNKALDKVTAQVNANRDTIKAKVTEAVRQQTEAAVREQVIKQAAGITAEAYEAAVKAGQISQQQQDAIESAIKSNLEKQMNSDEIKKLIADNTELQAEKAVSEAMSSEEVQSQLNKTTEGAKSVISLKESLDSYNAFYLGLQAYTSGVSDAASGAAQLKTGAGDLKMGTSQLSEGADELLKGLQQMKNGLGQMPELRDGVMELSKGLKQFQTEGIETLTDLINGDLKGLEDRFEMIGQAARNYKSFSGICDGTDGSVKFIYKTDAVEKEETK